MFCSLIMTTFNSSYYHILEYTMIMCKPSTSTGVKCRAPATLSSVYGVQLLSFGMALVPTNHCTLAVALSLALGAYQIKRLYHSTHWL
jgi:hypothetical protein